MVQVLKSLDLQHKISYDEFLGQLRKEWAQGQHLTIGGPTGSGKTWIAADVLTVRRYVVAISNKKQDESLDRQFIGHSKFKTVTRFPPNSYKVEKVLFWIKPKGDLLELDFIRQKGLIRKCISHCFNVGSWCIYFDDLFYISDTLGMKKLIQWMYTNIRSNGNTIVSCLQRPFWVPVEAVSQTSHFLMLHFNDERDVLRVAESYGVSPKTLLALNSQLRVATKKEGGDFIWLRQGKEPVFVERKAA